MEVEAEKILGSSSYPCSCPTSLWKCDCYLLEFVQWDYYVQQDTMVFLWHMVMACGYLLSKHYSIIIKCLILQPLHLAFLGHGQAFLL